MKKTISLDNKDTTEIENVLKTYDIEPQNIKLYVQALTHTSFVNKKQLHGDYERLEFLGDAIIQFVSSEYFYKQYSKFPQGKLTTIRSRTVSTEALSKISIKMGLPNLVKSGGGKMENDVKQSAKVQADLFEALVAAMYLDFGLTKTKKFITNLIFPSIDKVASMSRKDPKSSLQEYFQSISRENIKYIVDQLPNKLFLAKAIHDKQIYGTGTGITKKEAEVNAAIEALNKLNKNVSKKE